MSVKMLFNKTSLLLYVLTIPNFFVLGLLFAKFTEVAKHQGLAGGAIVLMYGIMFACGALVIAVILVLYTKQELIKKINRVLASVLVILILYIVYNVLTKEKPKEKIEKPSRIPTKTAEPITKSSILSVFEQNSSFNSTKNIMSLGFFKPNFYESKVMYFYGNPNLDKSIREHSPTDSVVFTQIETGGHTISYAPPWLVPAHFKLDYDILYFEVISVGSDFLKINANEIRQHETYVDRYSGKLIYWPEFLLQVNSVEFMEEDKQRVKTKPLAHSSNVNKLFAFLKPVLIKSNWMKVKLIDENYNTNGEGWIKWRENDRLLITYSLLS